MCITCRAQVAQCSGTSLLKKMIMQELSWLAGYDDSEEKKRSIFSVAAEAVLLALHRPLAV